MKLLLDHYAECHYAECRILYVGMVNAECHYAQCNYAESYSAKCRGAF